MSMDYSKQKCLVCGDKASGLHYTVVSCESCKSFFGRKIKSKAKFQCEANGNCVMDLYTRRHCPACRLKKCLDVGMKPERVWDEKRLETRKPLERKNKKKQSQQPVQPPPPPVSTSTAIIQQDLLPKLNRDQEDLITNLEKAKEEARGTNFTYKPHGKFEQILQKVHDLSMVFMGRDPKDYPYDPSQFQFPPMGMGGGMFGGGGGMPPMGGPPMGAPPPGGKTNGYPFTKPMDLTVPNEGSTHSNHSNGSPEETTNIDGVPSQNGVKIKVEPDNSPMDSAITCQQMTNGKFGDDMKPTDLPIDLNKPPGSPLNQQVLIYNMTLMGVMIRQTVTFTKAIPAFRRLSYEDQAVLIKNAILEILILRCAENYNPENNSVVDDITGSEWSCEAMLASGFATSAEPTLKFVQALHGMHLSKSELALLQAITIISPDRPDIENREDVEKIQRPMVETLQVLAKLNHPEDKVFFAKLIMKLTDVRDLVTRHISDLMQMRVPDSQFESLFPLITEIFNL